MNLTGWNHEASLQISTLQPYINVTQVVNDPVLVLYLQPFTVVTTCPDTSIPSFTYSVTLSDLTPLPTFMTFNQALNTLTINATSVAYNGLYTVMLFGILPAYQSGFALINVNITGNTAPPYFKGGLPLTLQVKQCQNLTYTLPQIFDPDGDAFEAPVVQLD